MVFFGNFGTQNLGNEYTLQSIVHNARKYLPDAELTCICPDPEDVSARHKIPAIRMSYRYSKDFQSRMERRRNSPIARLSSRVARLPLELIEWAQAFKALRGAGVLVMPGTGMLGDFGISPLGLHYQILKWSIVAKLRHCKLFFVSVGAGPIAHPVSRWIVKRAASLADYRSYRDSFSREYLARIGFDTSRDFVYPDLAFSLTPRRVGSRRLQGHSRVIGLGLMDYYGQRMEHSELTYQSYLDKVTTFTAWLIEQKYIVRFLIGDVAYDRRIRRDVLGLLQTRGIKYEGQIIDEPISSVEEVIEQLRGTDIVVATRFHSIVLALMLGKPVLAISYHKKIDSLMAALELVEYSQSVDQLDPSLLVQKFIKLEQSSESLKLLIRRKVHEYHRNLDKQYAHIFKDLSAESRSA